MFFSLTLYHANDVFLCTILILFTLHFNAWTWFIRCFFLVSRFQCEQHRYLRKRSVPPLSPLLQKPPASSYSPLSPPRISSQHPPLIPKIYVLFLSSLVAGSLWKDVRTRFSFSNKCFSLVLFCTSSWVVLGCYLCNNYPLYWLCPQPYPLVCKVFLSILWRQLSIAHYLTLYNSFILLILLPNCLSQVFLSLYLNHR